jgi:hypothetical protein
VPAEREPAGYKAAISAGVAEYEQKNFAESREQFRRAHALFPNARTLRGLGITEFELRNYGDSVSFLEQALASDAKRLEGPLREETEAVLARAKGYVGEVHLDLEPSAATVIVDGITVEIDPHKSLVLDVGDHVLEFRSEGRLAERRAIKVKGGQVESLHVVLPELVTESVAAPVAAPLAPAPSVRDSQHSERVPVYKRWWLWTTLGVVVAGAAVATALLLTAETTTKHAPVTTASTPDGVTLRPLWSY